MPKPLVFVSHIADEKDLAILVKDDLIEAHLLGSVDVFVSSDSRVNTGGQSWLKNIEDGLKRARFPYRCQPRGRCPTLGQYRSGRGMGSTASGL